MDFISGCGSETFKYRIGLILVRWERCFLNFLEVLPDLCNLILEELVKLFDCIREGFARR
jgi:hypothetical protein